MDGARVRRCDNCTGMSQVMVLVYVHQQRLHRSLADSTVIISLKSQVVIATLLVIVGTRESVLVSSEPKSFKWRLQSLRSPFHRRRENC